MYLVMRFLNHFASAEEGPLRFTALDFGGDNIIIAGQVLYLRHIRQFVEKVVEEVEELLRSELFFGLDMFDLRWSPGVVHDEPRNRSVGYSCFYDPANSFHEHKFDLLQVILSHPSFRGRFHTVSKKGEIIWKAGPCFTYMALYHKIEMLLFCGTQTSVGEPGRASEMASNLIGNVSGGTIRNVFMLFQFLCLMGTYNKIGKEVNMMRVPHPEIGRLYILCFTFIRPVIVVWQRYFNGPKAAARAKHNLFFGLYRPVTSSELSRSLSYHTKRLLNIRMTVRLWRHVATWFLDYHSIRFNEYLPLSRSLLAFQSGHGPGMHAQYASDARLPSIDFHVFFDTMGLSGAWHRLVGFSHFSRPTLLEAMSCIPSPRMVGPPPPSPCEPERLTSVSLTIDVADEVKRRILPDILEAISQSRANDVAYILHSIGVSVRSPASRALTQPVTHLMHPSRLRDLRAFISDDSASFKDPQQALALELVRGKKPSVLIIGPTGKHDTFT
jgi:hypothetical protein